MEKKQRKIKGESERKRERIKKETVRKREREERKNNALKQSDGKGKKKGIIKKNKTVK